jgi:tetratricopeptide (TPR) repeat protein
VSNAWWRAVAIGCVFLAFIGLGELLVYARMARPELAKKNDVYYLLEGTRLVVLERYADARLALEEAVTRVGSPFTRYALGECLMLMGEPEKADAHLRCWLDAPELERVRAEVKNNVAWNDFLTGNPALLEEADRLSAEALSEQPSRAAFQGTRGAVMIALGRIDEGIPLVESALAGNNAVRSRAYNACCLAIAMLKRGDTAEAERYLAMARSWWPECPLLRRAPLPPARTFAREPGVRSEIQS